LSQLKLKNDFENEQRQITLEYTNLVQRNELLKATQAKYDAESAALAKAHAKQLYDDLRKIKNDGFMAGIDDQVVAQQLQLKFQLDSDIESANLEIANVEDRNKKIAALEATYAAKILAIKSKALVEFQIKYNQFLIDQQVASEQKQEEDLKTQINIDSQKNDIVYKSAEKKAAELAYLNDQIAKENLDAIGQQAAAELEALAKKYEEEKKQYQGNEEALLALKKQYERKQTEVQEMEGAARLEIIAQSLNAATLLFSQGTLAYKVIATAEAVISTWSAVAKTLAAFAGVPIPGFAIAQSIAIGLAGLANVAKIVAVQVPGGGTGGIGGMPSVGATTPAPIQVTPPAVSYTKLPEDQINQIGNAATPIRAYVLEADVTDSQTRITRLNRAARLGG